MKQSILFIAFLLIFSCKDKLTESSAVSPLEKGEYSGVFTFTENGNTATGNVKFTFTDTSYTCTPEKRYLPPAGGGKYELQKDKLILTDLVIHTTEFDWTLILGGYFNYSKNSNTFVLTQEDKVYNRMRHIELTKLN